MTRLFKKLIRADHSHRPTSPANSDVMRYYTMTWWHGIQNGTFVDPGPEYAAHLERVRQELPAERLPTFDAILAISVHDANLRELRLLPDEGTLRLELDHVDMGERVLIYEPGDDLTDEERENPFLNRPMYEVKSHPVRVSITYTGVRRLTVTPAAEGGDYAAPVGMATSDTARWTASSPTGSFIVCSSPRGSRWPWSSWGSSVSGRESPKPARPTRPTRRLFRALHSLGIPGSSVRLKS